MDKKIDKIFKKAHKIVEERNKVNQEVKNLALEAIKYKNAKMICIIGYNFSEDLDEKIIDKMASTLNEIGEAKYIHRFATQVENAPIYKLAKGIINTKNVEYITLFAQIKGAPVEELADSVAKYGDAQAIYNFAMTVENVPKDKLTKVICKKGSKLDIEAYSYDVLHTSPENIAGYREEEAELE